MIRSTKDAKSCSLNSVCIPAESLNRRSASVSLSTALASDCCSAVMSHEELQAFLMRYADGLLEKDGKSIDLREVEKDLRQIKGIGDKRVEEIMAVFERHLGV